MRSAATFIAIILIAALTAGHGEGSERVERQKLLQAQWEACLFKTGARFAETSEPAEIVVRAVFAVCQPEEDELFKFFQSESSPRVAKIATEQLFPAIRQHYEDRLLAIILDTRTR